MIYARLALSLLRAVFGDEALIDLAVRMAITGLLAIAMVLATSAWAFGYMSQPGGMWLLASQAPGFVSAPVPGQSAAPVLPPVAIPVPAPVPVGQWVDGPPYNQYDPRSYRSSAVYATWHPAACTLEMKLCKAS